MYGTISGAAGVAGGAALAATGGTALGWVVLSAMTTIIVGIAVLRLATRNQRSTV